MRSLRSRSAFTLIELLVFAAIFAVASVVFVAVLIAVTRIQVRQMSVAEVAQQSQLVLQTVQRYVESAQQVDMVTDQPTSTLRLRTAPSFLDPTRVFASGTLLYIQQGTSTAVPLTSNRVSISNVSFTKRANPGGRDSVSVVFSVSYNTQNIQQRFVQALNTSFTRVNAATFDSDVRASTTNLYKLGATTQEWQSINNTMFFGGSGNVGIGNTPASSGVKFQVYGGNAAIDAAGNGLVLKSPGGTCYLLTISNAGILTTSTAVCP